MFTAPPLVLILRKKKENSSCDTTNKSPHKSTTFSPARKKLARTTTTDDEGQLPGIYFDIPSHITDLNWHTYSGGVVATAYSLTKFQPFFGSTSNVHISHQINITVVIVRWIVVHIGCTAKEWLKIYRGGSSCNNPPHYLCVNSDWWCDQEYQNQ